MILCLVGTNPYDFSRLIKKLDEIAPSLNMPIVIQTGNTTYEPKNCEYFTFKAKNEVMELMQNAKLVIAQGGYGSMTDAIMMNKRLIAVPRLRAFNEAQDNQVELVEYFESKGYLKACYEINELEGMIDQVLADEYEFNKYERETDVKVSDIIRGFLNEI